MSLAERTRAAVRESPFLFDALRAGALNYSAAARALDVGDDEEAVATALRRFGDRLPALDRTARDARVTMHRGIAPDGADPLLSVGGTGFSPAGGDLTAVVARGAVDAVALAHALGVCRASGVAVEAAGVGADGLVLVVTDRDGPAALRLVEAALAAVPDAPPD